MRYNNAGTRHATLDIDVYYCMFSGIPIAVEFEVSSLYHFTNSAVTLPQLNILVYCV